MLTLFLLMSGREHLIREALPLNQIKIIYPSTTFLPTLVAVEEDKVGQLAMAMAVIPPKFLGRLLSLLLKRQLLSLILKKKEC